MDLKRMIPQLPSDLPPSEAATGFAVGDITVSGENA